jgi:drug/metabolite transporter (DMT)-like permease
VTGEETAVASRRTGLVTGLVAALAFATSGPVIKPLLEAGWTPGAAMVFRLGIGAVLLVGPALVALRGRYRLLRDEWRVLVAFGVFSTAGCSTLYYLAVDRLPVAVALLLEYTAPLLLVGLAWLRTRRAPAPAVLGGAALAMAGLVLVLDLTGNLHLDALGIVFGACAAVCSATYWALSAKPIAVPPVTLAGVGMVIGTAVVGLLVLVGVLPFAAPPVHVDMLGAHLPWLVPILVVGALPTGFAYAISVVSVRLLGERVASFLALAEVLFAVLLAWALLGEVPLAVQAVGAVLVVAGVALVRRGVGEGASDELASDELMDDELASGSSSDAVALGLVVPEPRADGELDRLPA